jgi:hypothetical protein
MRRAAVIGLSGGLLLVAACADTDDPSEAPAASTTSSTMDTYHGDESTPSGKDEAGTAGGDANPDAGR